MLDEDNQFQLCDLATGELLAAHPSKSEISGLCVINAAANQDAVIYCDSTGVYRQTLDGVLNEQIIDGRLASFGMPAPTLMLAGVHMRRDGAFLIVSYNESFQYSLQKYVFDPDAPTAPTRTLTVFSMWDNSNARLAATVFMKYHPDFLVDIQVGKGDDDVVEIADVLHTLNTQLLAGAGPDLLILDDLPVESYIDKGVLLNLQQDIEPLLSSGELYENVVGSYRREDGIYTLPASFSVPIITGPGAQDLQGMADVVDYFSTSENPRAYQPDDCMGWFYPKLSHRWFAPDGEFLADPFREDLAAMKAYAAIPSYETAESPYDFLNQSTWYSGGGITLLIGNIDSIDNAAIGLSAANMRGEALHSLGGAFIPQSILGVNAASPQQEEARQFALEAVRQESQGVSIHSGIPVNRQAVTALIDRKEAGKGVYKFRGINIITEEEYSLEVRWFPEEDATAFRALLETLHYPAPNNATVRQIVLDETASFFADTATLEETLSAVESKLRQYRME